MAEATELEAAQQRLRRLERRLEYMLLGGLQDGLQDPSASALLDAICEVKIQIDKMKENQDG
jgi:hypothetical protein